jgi:hypothetical protein
MLNEIKTGELLPGVFFMRNMCTAVDNLNVIV